MRSTFWTALSERLNRFQAVEYMFPYDYQKEALAERLNKYNLKQVLFNLPAGNWAGGERGIACLPNRVGEFQKVWKPLWTMLRLSSAPM